MYSLHAPLWKPNDTLRKLLKEVMGYCDDDIKALENEQFCRNIAINLTIDEAKKITEIFGDNDFDLYLHDSNNKTLYWLKDLNIDLEENPPKSHYCDKPLLSEHNRIDVSVPEKVEPYVRVKSIQSKPVVLHYLVYLLWEKLISNGIAELHGKKRKID